MSVSVLLQYYCMSAWIGILFEQLKFFHVVIVQPQKIWCFIPVFKTTHIYARYPFFRWLKYIYSYSVTLMFGIILFKCYSVTYFHFFRLKFCHSFNTPYPSNDSVFIVLIIGRLVIMELLTGLFSTAHLTIGHCIILTYWQRHTINKQQ
jgi:hypothetical protein